MAKRIFDLPETKGTFEVRGLTSRTESQNFFRETPTKRGSVFRNVNFGLTYDEGDTLYMNMSGMPHDKVWASKRNKDGKMETMSLSWAQRDSIPEGYQLIGTTIGLTRTTDASGKSVSDSRIMTDFDACEYLHLNLEDDMPLYVRGNTTFSHYTDRSGNTARQVRYVPQRMYAAKEIDFSQYDGDKNKPMHNFTQHLVFTGIAKETDDSGKATGRFVLSAKIVTYNSIEDAEFIIESVPPANNFRKQIKPYTSISVWGEITPHHQTETVSNDDCWGEANEMVRVTGSTKIEMIIRGADPKSMDTETYSEAKVEEALRQLAADEKAENTYNTTSSTKGKTDLSWGEDYDSGNDDEEDW